MEEIIERLKSFIEGVEILPCNNGGIEVRVQDCADVPAVLSTVADAMYEDDADDVQITTDTANFKVFIDPVEREDDDDEEEG